MPCYGGTCGHGSAAIDSVQDLDSPLQGPSAKARKEESLGRCRNALNQFYGTDYFTTDSPHADTDDKQLRACPRVDEPEVRLVRSLYPPYWVPDPYPPKPRLTNPFKFIRRYGGCPNPRPWETDEQPAGDCKRTKVNVGRTPKRTPFKPVQHKKPWDIDMDVQGEGGCNLWHCKLRHKRSLDDRPW